MWIEIVGCSAKSKEMEAGLAHEEEGGYKVTGP